MPRALMVVCLLFCLPLAAQPKVSPSDMSPSGSEVALFKLASVQGVQNKPSVRTIFSLSAPSKVTKIWTYHWNNGRGAPGGAIGLRSYEGVIYGPWPAGTITASNGAPVYWMVKPDVVLPKGVYEVLDSDPATWSTNSEMNNMGCAWVIGYPTTAAEKRPAPNQPRQGLVEAIKSFRLQAIPEPVASIRKFTTAPALSDLTGIENVLFTETPPNVGWKYFFATSTFTVLPLPGDTALVLFYHPWSDMGLLTHWSTSGKSFAMDHAELLLGDCIRKSGETPFELQPRWERDSKTMTPMLSVPQAVGITLSGFETLFAGDAKTPALVKQRKQFDQTMHNADARKDMGAAANYRFEKCVTALVRYEQDDAFQAYRESATMLLAGMRKGDLGTLKATIPQTSQETFNLIQANATDLSRFKVVATLKSPTDCFVFLGHPADPNNVMAFWFQTDGGKTGLRQVNFLNHVFSITYIDQIKEVIEKGLEK
jgi:hypothetical protein